MRALITGVAGFIGSHLAQRLLSEGHEVVGIDNFSPYYDEQLKQANLARLAHRRFEFVAGDLATMPLTALLERSDVVFHLAGQPGVRASWGDSFADYISANIATTQRLLETAARGSAPRIVYASSSSVYGDAEVFPTSEDATPRPRSPYGVTKLAAEHLCRLYSANLGLATVSLRFFTVYGPRQRPDMAFTRFLRAAHEDREITLYGTGEQIRDFTYVDDIVSALITAASPAVPAGTVYNVSGGGSHSVNEVLEEIARIAGHPLRIIREDAARGDVARTGADITAIKRDLGWQPRVGLSHGLELQWAWVQGRES